MTNPWMTAARGLVVVLALLAFSAQAQLRAGDRLPEFDFALLDGRRLPAHALRGKVVVHMFWATWCPLCREDLPNLQRLYDTYRSRGLEIVALSVDRDASLARNYWRRHKYQIPAAMRTFEMRDEYGDLTGTPTYLVTDRNGIVRVRRTGVFGQRELERLLEDLL